MAHTHHIRRRIAALALGLALGIAATAPALAHPARSTRSDLATIARVERGTERVRGLHATHPVPVTMLNTAAFKQLVARTFDRDTSAANIRDSLQPLVLVGLLLPGTDLRAMLRAEQTNEVAAFYDPRVKRFYFPVRPGGLSLNDQVIVSHEYTHALQDQAFNLNRVRPDSSHQTIHDSDRELAETALIEGDATAEMLLYARLTFTQDQYDQFQREASQAAQGTNDHTPPFLMHQLVFPYNQGVVFELKLLKPSLTGFDFSGANAAFRHPPVSTREILHPELYLHNPTAQAPDLPPPQPALPAGWRRVDSDVWGQFELQDMLAQQIDAAAAQSAADGWRADRYALFDRGSDFLMAWRIHTASASTATALARAFASYFGKRYRASLALQHGTLSYVARNTAVALRVSGSDLAIVLGSRGALQPEVQRALASMPSR